MGNCNNSQAKGEKSHYETRRGTIILSTGNKGVEYDKLFKLLIIGDSGSGKTSIVYRYSDGTFQTSHLSTIGVDFKSTDRELNGKKYRLQIWDTAGQERYRTITKTLFRSTTGVVFVFDLTNSSSFENVDKWVSEINANIDTNIAKILVGNKADLTEQREVSTEEAKKCAERIGCEYMETSAKSGQNVQELFQSLLHQIVDNSIGSDE